MTKGHAKTAPVLIENFDPFYLRNGLVWVPYYDQAGHQYLHCLTPEVVIKGMDCATAVLCLRNIIPFAARLLSGEGERGVQAHLAGLRANAP